MKTNNGVEWYDITNGKEYKIWFVSIGRIYKRYYHMFNTKDDAIKFIKSLQPTEYRNIVYLDCNDSIHYPSGGSAVIVDNRGKL